MKCSGGQSSPAHCYTKTQSDQHAHDIAGIPDRKAGHGGGSSLHAQRLSCRHRQDPGEELGPEPNPHHYRGNYRHGHVESPRFSARDLKFCGLGQEGKIEKLGEGSSCAHPYQQE